MKKRWLAVVAAVSICLPLMAKAADREEIVSRVKASAEVLQEVMGTPDKAIPRELLESAKCIAIIPSEKKAAFVVGGSYGKGVATCRNENNQWSPPIFIMAEGGSAGFQIGGASTDVILVFRSQSGFTHLLSDKFKIGADATAAAGPVGRDAKAGTDLEMRAEILTYSRSRGAFAGVSLDGTVVKADRSADGTMYGKSVAREAILGGQVKTPEEARPLLAEIARNAGGSESRRGQ